MPKAKAAPAARKVVYPDLLSEIAVGDAAITVDRAKELLGWEVETDSVKFGDRYLLKDEEDKKIRCTNNTGNRPYDDATARKYAQDILNRNWRLNGEAIIVGNYGQILSGQHRLVGLVLAAQIWAGNQHPHWAEKWETEPTIESFISYGLPEDMETIRTLDNVRPRTLADVLFCGEDSPFAKSKAKDREMLCRMTDNAVKQLWERTGVKSTFDPYRTHSTDLDFIDRHPRVLKCVRHLHEENAHKSGEDAPIGKYYSPGYASALCYLMGSASSDGDVYRAAEVRTEKKLDWSLWDRAQEFWVLLASASKEAGTSDDRSDFKEVRLALAALKEDGSIPEKRAVIIKAWKAFAEGRNPTAEDIALHYLAPDEDGEIHLKPDDRNVDCGGIDLGGKKGKKDDDDTEDEDNEENPTPEEVEAQKADIKAKNLAKMNGSKTRREPGEVPAPEPITYDKDGKPPVPTMKKPTPKPKRTAVQEAQTEAARKHDEEDSIEAGAAAELEAQQSAREAARKK